MNNDNKCIKFNSIPFNWITVSIFQWCTLWLKRMTLALLTNAGFTHLKSHSNNMWSVEFVTRDLWLLMLFDLHWLVLAFCCCCCLYFWPWSSRFERIMTHPVILIDVLFFNFHNSERAGHSFHCGGSVMWFTASSLWLIFHGNLEMIVKKVLPYTAREIGCFNRDTH